MLPLKPKRNRYGENQRFRKDFRVRTIKNKIIFFVKNTEKKIYVTHIEARKKAYEKLG